MVEERGFGSRYGDKDRGGDRRSSFGGGGGGGPRRPHRGGEMGGGDRRGGGGFGGGFGGGERSGGGDRSSSFSAKNADVRPGRLKGTFKWFNMKSGYGFIKPASGNESDDMFAHVSALDGALHDAIVDMLTRGGDVTEIKVVYSVAVPKPVSGGQSSRRNSDKPFALDVTLASDRDEESAN